MHYKCQKRGAVMSENADKTRLPTSIRLPEALEDAVRSSAAKSGRTLSGEIKALIERGLSGQKTDDALFGETPEEVSFNRAIGETVALVRFQVGQWNDPRSDAWAPGQYANLAAAKAAAELLAKLPPDDGLDEQAKADAAEVGRVTARRLFKELQGGSRRETLAGLAAILRLAPETSS